MYHRGGDWVPKLCATQPTSVPVRAEVIDGADTLASNSVMVLPSQAEQVIATTDASPALWCRFSVPADAHGLRGFVELSTPGAGAAGESGNTRVLEAAAAPGGPAGLAATTLTPPLDSIEGNLLGCLVQYRGAAAAAVDGRPRGRCRRRRRFRRAPGRPGQRRGHRSPSVPCAGAGDGDGAVAINELVTLVNLVLDGASAAACPAGDADRNGVIDVAEVVGAVANALGGCPV